MVDAVAPQDGVALCLGPDNEDGATPPPTQL